MSSAASNVAATRAAERRRVRGLVRRHGWNATSSQVLEGEFAYWFCGGEACVAYVDTGSAWVAAGAPLCASERLGEVAASFEAAAARAGRRACFFGTEQRFARAAPTLRHLPIGEQPVWDPRRWPATLSAAPSLREQLRRARAKGVRVRRLSSAELGDARLRRAIERLIEQWQRAKALPPMGFLVRLDPLELAEHRRLFVASAEPHLLLGLAALAPVPARGGWFLEHLVRAPGAPNGTAELLVDAAMREAAALASGYFTLGLAPLAGEVPAWLGLARRYAAPWYDFGGLQRFKAKLRPEHWAPIHLSHARAQAPLWALRETLRAFARGDLLSFALEALRRAPAPSSPPPPARAAAVGAAPLALRSRALTIRSRPPLAVRTLAACSWHRRVARSRPRAARGREVFQQGTVSEMADVSRGGGLDPNTGAPARPRVLVVEGPSAPLSRITSRELGVELIRELGPARALERLEADGDFAVIVCEEDVGGASGLELLDTMRSISPTTARVLVAGSTSPEPPRVQDVVFRRVSPRAAPSELAAAIHDAIDYHQLLSTSPVQPVEPGRVARDAILPPAHPCGQTPRRAGRSATDAVVIDVPEAAPELVVVEPGASRIGLRVVGRTVELLPGVTVVGRSRTCHIPIPDPHISRRHATFSNTGGVISVRNVSSTNRLRVNGASVERDASCPLKVGDRVTLGSHEIELCALGDYCPSFEPTQNTSLQRAAAEERGSPSTLATLALVADKCFAFGHVREAERISRPLLEGLWRHCASGAKPGPGDVELATGLSLRIAESNHDGEWINYLFQLYTAIEEPMSAEVIERLYRLVPESAGVSMSSFRRYMAALSRAADRHGPTERFLMRRLQGLEAPLMMSAHL